MISTKRDNRLQAGLYIIAFTMIVFLGLTLLSSPVLAHEKCPPHHGEVKDGDADGDNKTDWLFEKKTYYPSGLDVEVWCLDHGPTGDYGLRISIPHDDYVWAGGCFFWCGNNSGPTVVPQNGNVTVFWDNTAPDGRDLHFKFKYPDNTLTVTRTWKGTPINSTVIPAPKNWTDLRRTVNQLLSAVEDMPPAGLGSRIDPSEENVQSLIRDNIELKEENQQLSRQITTINQQLSDANLKISELESEKTIQMIIGLIIGLIIGGLIVFFIRKK